MLSETRKSIIAIDAFLNNAITGYTIIENGKAYLQTDDELIQLSDQHEIQILNLNGFEYVDVTYQEMLDTKCTDGWPLYAGMIALVKTA